MDWEKIGENEPCPCGSGKAYKDCCGVDDLWSPERRSIARSAILDAVDNQLRDFDPPETKQAFDRLIKEGYAEEKVKELIAAALTCEMFAVLKEQRPFDRKRYAEMLSRLPNLL